jgi:hypothetical protein
MSFYFLLQYLDDWLISKHRLQMPFFNLFQLIVNSLYVHIERGLCFFNHFLLAKGHCDTVLKILHLLFQVASFQICLQQIETHEPVEPFQGLIFLLFVRELFAKKISNLFYKVVSEKFSS